ncbi:methyltransferase [Xanthomonas campestris]|uniref:methyltransferase family protein n=1 Tax=Xanthomonas TaxID=338 RepID=UPI002B1F65CA|nr:methyltransferase [Xanthomonas campestris]
MLQRLETRVPPPVLLALLGVIAAGTAALLPSIALPLPGRMLMAGTCVLGGIALNVLPKLTFARAGTTINPLAPQRATQLVTTGLHRHTRNPMYLGRALLLGGWIVSLQQDAALVLVGPTCWQSRGSRFCRKSAHWRRSLAPPTPRIAG